MSSIELIGLGDLGEPGRGDDLAAAVAARGLLRSGDVVVVARLVVAAVEGRVVGGRRDDLVAEQARRILRRRPDGTVVAETHQGFVLIDAGVVAAGADGAFALLPDDPGRSARRLRDALAGRHRLEVGVVVAEPALCPWSAGVNHIAIGSAAPGQPDATQRKPTPWDRAMHPDALAGAAGLLLYTGGHAAVAIRGGLGGAPASSLVGDLPAADIADHLFR